ncbi:MAG: hypothetical protein ACR2KU_03045 [Gammaproteobacteria bacterium]|nr:hypothetical protein [Gammaproteobacteria bacterium]MBA3731193.1 hypothetical protein [Gammaproteobacteria bacterium]
MRARTYTAVRKASRDRDSHGDGRVPGYDFRKHTPGPLRYDESVDVIVHVTWRRGRLIF